MGGKGEKIPPVAEPKRVAVADADAGTGAAQPNRPAVPDKPSQQAAEAKIRDIFLQEFAEAKTGKAHAALGKKLLEQADGTKDDAAAHYVLLNLAGQQAVLGGDLRP